MLSAGAGNHALDVEFLAKAGVERAKAVREIGAQTAEIIDIGAQLAADAFLIGVGKLLSLGDGAGERFCWHSGSISY